LLLPKVLEGRASLVGPPLSKDAPSLNGSARSGAYLGKPGLTGLAQINERDDLTTEEIAKYNLYYAKNQSLMLDIEIILKSILRSGKR
jgi:lipopolysaccharide/colanic/teichoic acid biosynthesis glycosyltransferase